MQASVIRNLNSAETVYVLRLVSGNNPVSQVYVNISMSGLRPYKQPVQRITLGKGELLTSWNTA